MKKCKCGKAAEKGKGECFRCRVGSIGFTFVGGGGYGRKMFSARTNEEKRREVLGDKVVGVDVVPASEFGG